MSFLANLQAFTNPLVLRNLVTALPILPFITLVALRTPAPASMPRSLTWVATFINILRLASLSTMFLAILSLEAITTVVRVERQSSRGNLAGQPSRVVDQNVGYLVLLA